MPAALREQLGVQTEMRRRSVSSYSPRPDGSGLLVRAGEPPSANWAAFAEMTGRVARAVFPTLDPAADVTRGAARPGGRPGAAWQALVERPLGEVLAHYFADDLERGIVATDALIGTFAGLDDESLRQNRCFLYHIIGNGTGDWDVPVGGMGALTEELAALAWAAGAEVRLECEVTRDRDRRRRRRGALRRRLGRRAAGAGQRRSRGAGAAAGRAAAGRSRARGRAAEAQHAARAPAAAARRVAGPARGVRRHVPRQRVRDPARGRLRERAARRGAGSGAVRDLLPLAHRSRRSSGRSCGRRARRR